MQLPEIPKRRYFTRSKKLEILEEFNNSGMSLNLFSRSKGIHPVQLYKWKRAMSEESKRPSISAEELLEEIERLKSENGNLKKAVSSLAVDNEILKTANDILKKSQRTETLNLSKKS